MKKTMLLIVALFSIGLQTLFAQKTTVTGTVTASDDGVGIPGVSVTVPGTTLGTVTNMDGVYTISLPTGTESISFSFIGMETKVVEYKGQEKLNVALKSSSIGIDEVIAVAYGESTKASFTGTATKVSGEKLASKSVSNVSQALVGESAGVTVINTSGQPGSVAKVRIRGYGSINGNRSPLYVVDGIPLQGSMNSINPNDIESTTILKDAAATAIYGSRGANGVVLITTKKGVKGKSNIEVEAKYGVTMRLLPDYDVIESPEQYMELSHQGLVGKGRLSGAEDAVAYANENLFGKNGVDAGYNLWDKEGAQLIGADGKFNSNVNRRYTPGSWRDELFDNGARKEITTKLSGGNDKTTYYTSFGFLDEEGYYLKSAYERFTGRVNITHQVKPWLKGTANMSYARATSNNAGQSDDSTNGFWFVANMPSIYGPYARDAEGNKIEDTTLGGYVFDYGDSTYGKRGFGALANPIATNIYDVSETVSNQVTANASLVATFLKDFKFSTRFGLESYGELFDNLSNPWYGGAAEQGGSIYKRHRDIFAYTMTNMLSYSKEKGAHSFDAFVAQEAQLFQYKRHTSFKSNLADPYNRELDNAVVSSPSSSYTREYAISSYFGQLKYDYDDKYFFQGVVRRDGSSRFVNEKWGTFGSISAAWMMSKEAFLSNSSWINDLKLKASYGLNGDQGSTGYYTNFYPGYDKFNVSNLNDEVSIAFDSKGNPDLTWETSKMFQAGVEFSVFNNVLEGSVDYYNKVTDDLIFDRRVAPSKGYALVTVNDGLMVNNGLEINLTSHLVNTSDLKVDFNINGAFQENEIKEMPIEPSTGLPKVLDLDGISGRSKGHGMFDIYTREYAGTDAETGVSTWYRYYNETDEGKEYIASMTSYMAENEGNIGTIGRETTTEYGEATNKYIDKSPIPTVQGAFSFDVDYKGLELSAQFTYSLGGHSMDYKYADLMHDGKPGSNNWHKDILNAWTPDNNTSAIPVLTAGYNNLADRTSDRFITSTDFLALNNVRLGYNLPKSMVKRWGLENLKFWVSGDNLYLKTARDGYYSALSEDGESERYNYSPLSSVTGGINIKF